MPEANPAPRRPRRFCLLDLLYLLIPFSIASHFLWGGTAVTFVLAALALVPIAVVLAVAVAHFVALDAKTNWFEGVELLAVYAILGAAFYYLPG